MMTANHAGLNFNSPFYVLTDYGTIILLRQNPSRLTPSCSPVGLIVPAIHGLKIKCSCGALALNLSASALIISIILFALGIIIKWVFYYTIVKAGAKAAIRDSLSNQNTQLQAQVAVMQKQLELQQQEIQRLQGQISNRL